MRAERYRDLIPGDRLAQSTCSVIGVGAIGRQVSIQLAAMGVGGLQLIDHDVVEESNLGPQAYLESDVGMLKVEATADLARRLAGSLAVETVPRRFSRTMATNPVVFCCVDSIDTRGHIWSCVRDSAGLFVDGRMAAEVLRVISVADGHARERYGSTLFDASRALQQSCTARSTIYCANIAAGWMVAQFSQWLRGLPVEFDVTVNLLAGELSVA